MTTINKEYLEEKLQRMYERAEKLKWSPEQKAVILAIIDMVEDAPGVKKRKCKECEYYKADGTYSQYGYCTREERQTMPAYFNNRRRGSEPACTRHFSEEEPRE